MFDTYYYRAVLIILKIVLLSSVTRGQTTFQKHYGTPNSERCYDLLITPDSGYVMVGFSTAIGAGSQDFCLIKLDKTGTEEWAMSYGGPTQEIAKSVALTQDGGYILCGYTNSFGVGADDVYLVKTDSLGDVVWAGTYGSPSSERGNAVVATSDGGFAVVGGTYQNGGSSDAFLLKVNAQGAQEFMKTFGDFGYEEAYSLITTNEGGFGIIGSTSSFGAGGDDIYFVKTDSLGDHIWSRTYGGDAWDRGSSIKQTGDGGFIIAGLTESFDMMKHAMLQCYLLKVDSFGIPEWSKAFGKMNSENIAYDVVESNDGGYCVVGYSGHFTGPYQAYIVKTSSTGDLEWSKIQGFGNINYFYAVEQTYDGGYVVGGFSNGSGSLNEFWLVRTNDAGYNKCNSADSITLIHDTLPTTTQPADIVIDGVFLETNAWVQTVSFLDERILCSNLCNMEAEFSLADSIFCQGDTIELNADAPGADGIQWFLEGDLYSNAYDTIYITDSLGSYNITLVADSLFCADSADHSVTIADTVISEFTFVVNNLTVSYLEQSQFFSSFMWYFGTGDSQDSIEDPTYTFPDTGKYTTCLVVTNSCSTDSTCYEVYVNCPYPAAGYTYTTSDLTIEFVNTSILAESYYWIFGDGNSSIDTSVSHTYSAAGTYEVCLIASNSCGLKDSCVTVTVTEPIPGINQFTKIKSTLFTDYELNRLIVDFEYPIEENIRLSLTNTLGELLTANYSSVENNKRFVFDISMLAEGLYFLTFSSGEGSFSQKFVVVH